MDRETSTAGHWTLAHSMGNESKRMGALNAVMGVIEQISFSPDFDELNKAFRKSEKLFPRNYVIGVHFNAFVRENILNSKPNGAFYNPCLVLLQGLRMLKDGEPLGEDSQKLVLPFLEGLNANVSDFGYKPIPISVASLNLEPDSIN